MCFVYLISVCRRTRTATRIKFRERHCICCCQWESQWRHLLSKTPITLRRISGRTRNQWNSMWFVFQSMSDLWNLYTIFANRYQSTWFGVPRNFSNILKTSLNFDECPTIQPTICMQSMLFISNLSSVDVICIHSNGDLCDRCTPLDISVANCRLTIHVLKSV